MSILITHECCGDRLSKTVVTEYPALGSYFNVRFVCLTCKHHCLASAIDGVITQFCLSTTICESPSAPEHDSDAYPDWLKSVWNTAL